MDEKLKKMLENANPEMDVPSKNPIHFDNGKWWFWDETWSDRLGPFDTEEQTKEALRQYCEEVLGD